jgi:hypothetical protein
MSTRYTRSDAVAVFSTFSRIMSDTASNWALDHNATYGGYVIVERNADGSESRPFGNRRRPAGEFCRTLQFAVDAVAMARVANNA